MISDDLSPRGDGSDRNFQIHLVLHSYPSKIEYQEPPRWRACKAITIRKDDNPCSQRILSKRNLSQVIQSLQSTWRNTKKGHLLNGYGYEDRIHKYQASSVPYQILVWMKSALQKMTGFINKMDIGYRYAPMVVAYSLDPSLMVQKVKHAMKKFYDELTKRRTRLKATITFIISDLMNLRASTEE